MSGLCADRGPECNGPLGALPILCLASERDIMQLNKDENNAMRFVIGIVISLLWMGTAAADIGYSVSGVRPGDVLNMRLNPDPRAPIVQTIPHNGTGLALTGRAAGGDWVEVTYQRRRGWVNGRFLGYGAFGSTQVPATLDCTGTEPFWSIALKPGSARADLMFTERRMSFRLTSAKPALGRSDLWQIKGSAKSGELSLIVRQETCSDGMSDNRYPYSTIAFISGVDMIAGCCRPGAVR